LQALARKTDLCEKGEKRVSIEAATLFSKAFPQGGLRDFLLRQ